MCLFETLLKELGPILMTFSNFLRIWYQNVAHIFLIIHVKCYGPNMFRFGDTGENVSYLWLP